MSQPSAERADLLSNNSADDTNSTGTEADERASLLGAESGPFQEASVDEVMEHIGMGKFQKRMVALGCIAAFSTAFHSINLSVLLPSVKGAWDLTDQQLAGIATTYYIGLGVGAILFGRLSDYGGRLPCYIAGFFTIFAFGALSAFSPNVYWFAGFRFAVGVGFSAHRVTQFVLISEFAVNEDRDRMLAFVEMCYGLGGIAAVIVSSATSGLGYQAMLLITAVPSLFVGVIYAFTLFDTSHFFSSRKQYSKAHTALLRIAEENNIAPHRLYQVQHIRLTKSHDLDHIGRSKPLCQLMFSSHLAVITGILFALWVSSGTKLLEWLPLYLQQHPDMRHSKVAVTESAALLSVGEAMGGFLAAWVAHSFDRRYFIGFCRLISAVVALGVGFSNDEVVVLIFLPFVMMLMAINRLLMQLVTVEVYPTVIRGTVLGIFYLLMYCSVACGHWMMIGLLHLPFYSFGLVFFAVFAIPAIAVYDLPYDTRHLGLAETYYHVHSDNKRAHEDDGHDPDLPHDEVVVPTSGGGSVNGADQGKKEEAKSS